uniref:hypothetical protein n=1 Tax=Aspergillus sclerotioniger TaxID=319627 RepID=UPI002113918C
KKTGPRHGEDNSPPGASNDAQILFYIKKELGFGSVVLQDKTNKTHQFRVRHKKGILKLIEIFNGNILTSKKKYWIC